MRSAGSKNPAKVEEAKQMLDAELKRMAAAEDTLNSSVAEFEKERLTDVKVQHNTTPHNTTQRNTTQHEKHTTHRTTSPNHLRFKHQSHQPHIMSYHSLISHVP